MERVGTPGGREVEGSRHLQWQGQWRRVAAGAAEWRRDQPESLRPVRVRCRTGETQAFWGFTEGVRLQR
jgi:hypothetical protein